MKIFRSLKSKLILLTIVVVLGNFVFAKTVSAKSFLAEAGGLLLDPICDLLIFARRYCNKCIADELFD